MNRIASATCPRCGAELHPVAGQEQVTCQYCGTTSFVQRQQPSAVAGVPRTKSSAVFAVIGIVAVVLVGASAAAFALLANSGAPERGAPASLSPPQVAAVPTPEPPMPAAAAQPAAMPHLQIKGGFEPLVADIDGDGTADVVTAIATDDAAHYAVFSGRDGHELARTPALTDADRSISAVVGRRLISATQNGQLTGYGLANGAPQWTTALGARAAAFCAAKADDALLVVTDDERRLSIDLTTGRQSETKLPCTLRLTRPERGDDPRDRHDYSAPRGTESYHCGGVRVMGSQNYTVADQCLARARVDTDRLEGFIGHRLWKLDRNWLAFGIRKPGAYVPMLGLVSGSKLLWKQTVPLDNPLEADTGSPQHVGLAQGLVVATYAHEKSRGQFATAFAVADGTRRWHTALPKAVQNVSNLVTSSNRVFIQSNEHLLILDVADGKLIATVGQQR